MLISEKVGKGSGLTDSGRIQESKYYYQRGVAEDILSLKAVKQQFRRSLTTGILYIKLCVLYLKNTKKQNKLVFYIQYFFC